jgi:hypothetical protein
MNRNIANQAQREAGLDKAYCWSISVLTDRPSAFESVICINRAQRASGVRILLWTPNGAFDLAMPNLATIVLSVSEPQVWCSLHLSRRLGLFHLMLSSQCEKR